MTEAVEIKQIMRRMRGKSQAHLVKGADDNFYVAKFANNPKGNRTLINDWIGNHVYDACGICVPPMQILRLTKSVLTASEDLFFVYPDRKVPIGPGLHLGSMCPVDPHADTIFDFIPRNLLTTVLNRQDFVRASVLDAFLGQNTLRQALFVRVGVKGEKRPLCAYMVDHTEIFAGNDWLLTDSASPKLDPFDNLDLIADVHAEHKNMVLKLSKITEDQFHALASQLPGEWFAPNDRDEFAILVRNLTKRNEQSLSLVSEVDDHSSLLSDNCQHAATFRQFGFNAV